MCNVTIPLGLMMPAPGVKAVRGLKVAGSEKELPVTSAGVRLDNVERIPGRYVTPVYALSQRRVANIQIKDRQHEF